MSNSAKFSLTLSPEHVDHLRHHAALEDRSESRMIRRMILKYQPVESRAPAERYREPDDLVGLSTSRSIRRSITLKPELLDLVHHHAALENRRLMEMIRHMILQYRPAKNPEENLVKDPDDNPYDDPTFVPRYRDHLGRLVEFYYD